MNLKSNLKSFVILILVLQFIIIMLILKPGVTMPVLAVGFLVLAMLLSVNKAFCDRFFSFMNPGFQRSCGEKDSSLYRKRRRLCIMNFYMLAILGISNGYRVWVSDVAPGLQGGSNQVISFVLAAPTLLSIIAFFAIILVKSADEELLWNMLMGILFVVLLFVVYFSCL